MYIAHTCTTVRAERKGSHVHTVYNCIIFDATNPLIVKQKYSVDFFDATGHLGVSQNL